MNLDHLAIWTSDLERLRAFYETYFQAAAGAQYYNPAKQFTSYFLSFPAAGARLELMTRPGLLPNPAKELAPAGLAHFAICVGGVVDVDRLAERLRQDGYTLVGAPRWTGDGYYEAIVLDPDGNPVEFTAGSRRPPAGLSLRALQAADAAAIAAAFSAQDWNKPAEQYQRYYQDQLAGRREVIVAELNGAFAGYTTILWDSAYPHFHAAGIPEIMDFNVLMRFRRQGVGSALMDEAERRIAARSPAAGLGVGLLHDYGAAQQLYIERGYQPDGRGVFYNERQCQWGEAVKVDDDLVLYLTKQL